LTLIKHTIIYSISKGISGLLSFVAIILYTRWLNPEDYGKYALVMSAVGFINILFFQWFRQGITRFYAEYNAKGKLPILHQLMKANIYIYVAITMLMAIVGFMLYRYDAVFWIRMMPIIALVCLGMALFELFSQYFIARLTPIHYSISLLIRSVVAFLVSISLILLGFDYKSLFAGLLAGYTFAVIYSRSKIQMPDPARFYKDDLKHIAIYSLPLTLTAGLNFVLGYINRFMIDYYGDKAETGLFTFGYDFSEQTLGVLMAIAATSALPIAMKYFSENGLSEALSQHMKKSLWLLLTITLPVAALLIGLQYDYSVILFGEKFRSINYWLIPLASISIVVLGIKSYYLDQIFYFYKKTKTQTGIVGIAAMLNITLNIIMIPSYGYMGAVYATVISYTSATVLTYFFVKKLMNVPVPVKEVITTIFAASVCAILLLTMPIANSVFQLILKAAAIMLVYAVLIFLFNRKLILNILGK
jgi:O-antigen/teichoic acid export membrane protein